MSEVYDRRREIQEAINAGERALDSLNEAARQLKSAGNWGIVDIFGGNAVSTISRFLAKQICGYTVVASDQR